MFTEWKRERLSRETRSHMLSSSSSSLSVKGQGSNLESIEVPTTGRQSSPDHIGGRPFAPTIAEARGRQPEPAIISRPSDIFNFAPP